MHSVLCNTNDVDCFYCGNSDSVALASVRTGGISCILRQDAFSRQLDGVDWFEWTVWSRQPVTQALYHGALCRRCARIVQVDYEEGQRLFAFLPSPLLPNRFPCNLIQIDDELSWKRPVVSVGPSGSSQDGREIVLRRPGGNGHRAWRAIEIKGRRTWLADERSDVGGASWEKADCGNVELGTKNEEQQCGADERLP